MWRGAEQKAEEALAKQARSPTTTALLRGLSFLGF